jgi:hypothetical protein
MGGIDFEHRGRVRCATRKSKLLSLRRTIIEYEAKVVQKIFSMALQGISFNKIAIELNKQGIKSKSGSLWYPLTIRRIVNNLTYTGKTYYGMSKRVGKTKVVAQPKESWTLLPDITPPIITEELFKRTQEAIKQAKLSRPIKPNATYLLTGFMKCPKCGSPIGGTTLNGKYRYYKCRGSNPTATRGKICYAGYIKADPLENSVWDKVLEMLSSPLTLLRTLTDENHQQPDKVVLSLNKEIDKLRKKLKAYPAKEKSLIGLLPHEAVTKDYVLDAINKLKQERLNDERQLESLLECRKEATQADHLKLKLSEVSVNKWSDLNYDPEEFENFIPATGEIYPLDKHQLTAQLNTKRGLLESIHLKVTADPKSYQFNFTLDGKVISTTDANELSSFEDELKRFEEQHPNVSVKDLLDTNKLLPEDTHFAKKVNQLKQNLVTIERTWGCLSSHAYDWIVPFSFAIYPNMV